MAQYKTHLRFNLFLALPVLLGLLGSFFHPSSPQWIIFTSCFIYASLFMNPDLDLAYKFKLLSLRGLLGFPFWLYSFFFRHRGISHYPILGTLSRLLWLGGFLYLGYFIFFSIESPTLLFFDYREEFFYGIGAIFLADLCHLALD